MIEKEHIDRLLARIPEIETALSDPATAANQETYRRLVREHAFLKKIERCAAQYFRALDTLQGHREIIASDAAEPELQELARAEIDELDAAAAAAGKALMLALLPPDPDEGRNAIVEIRAGTGGDEATLFAGDLLRMYSRYAENTGWKLNLIDVSSNELGGYKEAVFSVIGDGAYGRLRYESGGHRVQRVPVTESQGRIHTSAATVAVFPEAEPEDRIDIAPDEIRVDIFRSSGPGGQSVKAMGVLQARILDRRRREEQEKKGNARRTLIGSGDRSERVRTYNFPQNRLTDHRINLTLYSLDRIMEGDIAELLDALREHDVELRLQEEVG